MYASGPPEIVEKSVFDKSAKTRKFLKNRGLLGEPQFLRNLSPLFTIASDLTECADSDFRTPREPVAPAAVTIYYLPAFCEIERLDRHR